MTKPLIELCVEGIDGFLAAQEAGADRVELCASLVEGGLTPSLATIRAAVKAAQIPVHVIIRPRGKGEVEGLTTAACTWTTAAIGALCGFVFLHEQLGVLQWLAIAAVVVASAGATLGTRAAVAVPMPD